MSFVRRPYYVNLYCQIGSRIIENLQQKLLNMGLTPLPLNNVKKNRRFGRRGLSLDSLLIKKTWLHPINFHHLVFITTIGLELVWTGGLAVLGIVAISVYKMCRKVPEEEVAFFFLVTRVSSIYQIFIGPRILNPF